MISLQSKIVRNPIKNWVFPRRNQNFLRFFSNNTSRFLLKDMEYIKSNLYKISGDCYNLNEIFVNFLEETKSKNSRPTAEEFENLYFRNIVKLISCFIQISKNKLPSIDFSLLIDLFLNYAKIFERFENSLKTSKTILFCNKIWKTIYERNNEITPELALVILEIMCILDYKNKGLIDLVLELMTKNIEVLKIEEHLKVIKYLSQMNYKNELLIEILLDRLYPRIKEMNPNEIALFSLNISRLQYKINKHFLLELLKQFSESCKGKNLDYKIYTIAFSSFSQLEHLISHKFFYLDELDQYYEDLINNIVKIIKNMSTIEIGHLANCLQKVAIYDEKILSLILEKFEESLKGKFLKNMKNFGIKNINLSNGNLKVLKNMDKSSIEYKENLINYKREKLQEIKKLKSYSSKQFAFENYVRIIHCFAIFYYEKAKPCIKEFLNQLELISREDPMNFEKFIDKKYISRFLYSLSILFEAGEIKEISLSLLFLYAKNYENYYYFSISDITSLKLFYLFLKNAGFPNYFPKSILDEIFSEEKPQNSLSQMSYLALEVSKTLKKMNIFHQLEPVIENNTLTADLVIENNDKNLFIDIHGFQHYCRNCERLKGGGILKTKLFKGFGENIKYFIIPIFEWQLITEHSFKVKYLEKLLEGNIKLPDEIKN